MHDKTPNTRRTPSQFPTLQELASESGFPYNTLRDLVIRGHLPAVRLPGKDGAESRRIRVRRVDWQQLVDRSVEQASA